MKKISLFAVCSLMVAFAAQAAVPARGRAQTAGGGAAPAPATTTGNRANAPAATTAAAPVSNARAAVRGSAPVANAPAVAARSGTTPTAAPVAAARAATVPKQNVVQAGTGVAAATANTVVDEACKNKYYGCMDSFCMLDNDSGGRCLCSDQKAELDVVLAEIEKLDRQSYDMATRGVEKIELGAKADYVMSTAGAIAAESMEDKPATAVTGRPARPQLDLSAWNNDSFGGAFDADPFAETVEIGDPLKGKSGDALHSTVRNICVQQIPECAKDLRMLQMMYAQNVQSDCNAYRNELSRRKTSSQQKLAAAERALRDAALESFETANKWDLGQCAVEMRKCMITTGGCKDDFTGCVGIVAAQNAAGARGAKTVAITGVTTKIEIAASTMDAMLSKKPLCESVTNSCIAVKDKVWDVFLREIAPTLKTAELAAESNNRMSCIGNIADCFQQGCRENMDPNNPDGSFDLCLTRPEAMINICKVQLEACGIPTSSQAAAESHEIWGYVTARLNAMKVDACTREFKQCIQSDDRCGEDFTKCWGLDYNNIVNMCPTDKLIACSKNAKYDRDYMLDIVTGVMLGIDNNLLNECQAAVDAKMDEICGGNNCPASFGDKSFGTESLLYDSFNPNRIAIKGLLDFSLLKVADDGQSVNAGTMSGTSATSSNQGLRNIADKINRVITTLTSDTKIKGCVEGRNLAQVRGQRNAANEARFPDLLVPYIPVLINAGLETAQRNYNAKLDEFKKDAMSLAMAKVEEDKAAGKVNICLNAATLSPVSANNNPITQTTPTVNNSPSTNIVTKPANR
ncbi:MAG: hypothetical protein FWF97_03895 [Alphaproteobacteria bacterium]|nr:hypothetical protein [Alphaproteobacteria bacterium]